MEDGASFCTGCGYSFAGNVPATFDPADHTAEFAPEDIPKTEISYYMTGGNANKGLWYRRRNEAELFLTGDYAIDRENKFNLPSGVNWS